MKASKIHYHQKVCFYNLNKQPIKKAIIHLLINYMRKK